MKLDPYYNDVEEDIFIFVPSTNPGIDSEIFKKSYQTKQFKLVYYKINLTNHDLVQKILSDTTNSLYSDIIIRDIQQKIYMDPFYSRINTFSILYDERVITTTVPSKIRDMYYSQNEQMHSLGKELLHQLLYKEFRKFIMPKLRNVYGFRRE